MRDNEVAVSATGGFQQALNEAEADVHGFKKRAARPAILASC